MSIYIACYKLGREHQTAAIARFNNRRDFYHYCDETMAFRDKKPLANMTIEQLCEIIYDSGFGGIGARYYRRINARLAQKIGNIIY